MPPKKGNVIIKKDTKNKGNNKDTNKDSLKTLKKQEASLKSTDDGDLPDDDDYESEDLSELSESETELDTLSQPGEDEEEQDEEETEETEEETEEPEPEEPEDEEVDDTDECMYKKAKVKNLDDEKDDDEIELVYDDDNIKYDELVKPEDRISKPFMTVFERVRLLGDRSKQLSLGAKPMIKGLETMNPKEIAKLELQKGVIPLIIERVLPNGKKERWHPNELKIIN